MKKKAVSILLSLIMAASLLAGCGTKDSVSDSGNSQGAAKAAKAAALRRKPLPFGALPLSRIICTALT